MDKETPPPQVVNKRWPGIYALFPPISREMLFRGCGYVIYGVRLLMPTVTPLSGREVSQLRLGQGLRATPTVAAEVPDSGVTVGISRRTPYMT